MDNRFRSLILILLPWAMAAQNPLRVLCFGDSTTAPRAGVVPYCQQLEQSGRTMLNRGVPGNTTEMGRQRFERDVVGAHPDVVIIQFGINDSSVDVWKTHPESKPRVSLERYVENLTYFVEGSRRAGAQVILMTFNPLTWTPKLKELYGRAPYRVSDVDGFDEGREAYQTAIRQLCQEKQVRLIDVQKAYQKRSGPIDDLLLDGIHPNTLGHRLTANLLRPALGRR